MYFILLGAFFMLRYSTALEIIRWGNADVPGAIFWYANELDLSMEDIGVLSTIYYAFQKTRPLNQTGLKIGQVMQVCPHISKSKLSRNIGRLEKLGVISVSGRTKSFIDREIFLEPLMEKLNELVIRDHHQLSESNFMPVQSVSQNSEILSARIQELEGQLEEERRKSIKMDLTSGNSQNFKRVADFISKKTGNLMSIKMSTELHRWLDEMNFTPEFLLCMLELCFERNIYNPRDISKVARDSKEYSINTVEGLTMYFKKFVDTGLNGKPRSQFDPEVIEFGNYTGIDMNAEARKTVYYKWRYDWDFSHSMVMKAGEIMCQRTKNGGLEYVDSVLANWKSKNIKQVEEAQREILEFKNRNKKPELTAVNYKKTSPGMDEYEIFTAPSADKPTTASKP